MTYPTHTTLTMPTARLMPSLITALLLALAACTPSYHAHVTVEGAPDHHESPRDDRDPTTVITQSAHFAVRAASADVLAGWTVVFRDGGSLTYCRERMIYINRRATRWRDHLAHEITHAVLCETRPGTEDDDHRLMRDAGLCYGSRLCEETHR